MAAGCERISAGGLKQLAQAFPHLEVLRLGGSAACSEAALKALPHILPGLPPAQHYSHSNNKAAAAVAGVSNSAPAAVVSNSAAAPAAAAVVADSWEDAFASSSDDEEEEGGQGDDAANDQQQAGSNDAGSGSSSGGSGEQDSAGQPALQAVSVAANSSSSSSSGFSTSSRLKHLQALIWPDVPSAAVELVQLRCPRVLINPQLKPDKLTGAPPPREWDASIALDELFMQSVTAAALDAASDDAVASMAAAAGRSQQDDKEPVVHIADKFRQAYVDRARRLKEKERRLLAAEEREQLKASHALRTMHAWLDDE